MTAIPARYDKNKVVKLPQPKLLTFADYARLTPPENGNYELHNGKIIFMPSPIDKHQEVSGALQAHLYFHVQKHKLGKVLTAPMDTIFTPNDTVQPDILFVSTDRLFIIDRQVKGAPDFVVEILSAANTAKEMSYKKHLYESCGVKEYWVINVSKKTIAQYENIEGEFQLNRTIQADGRIESFIISDFAMNCVDIFNFD